MSLKTRLLVILGVTLTVTWSLAAAWLWWGLNDEVERTLDRRLAQSANMVAGLMARLPEDSWAADETQRASIVAPLKGVACQVTSAQGQVLARTHANMAAILDVGQPGYSYRQRQGEDWRVYTLIRDGVTITTADRVTERRSLMRDILALVVVPFAVALVISGGVLWWGTQHALRPLERWRAALSRRHHDDLSPVADTGLPRELRPLIVTLNELLARMRAAIHREQRFTDAAAHELRTPLTAVKTHLQVARRVEGDAIRQAVVHAEQGTQRLAATLDQLLALARIEGAGVQHETDGATVADIVRSAVHDTQEPARIVVPAKLPDARVGVSLELAATALRNVLDNSLKHGPAGLPVTLDVDLATHETNATAWVELRVHDQGPGVPDEALAHVTERFWRHSVTSGSGLGLAITAAIAERASGALQFQHPASGGFEVCMKLPQA
ncbi:ATP-binding protein [Chromohalobacter canadensis]|uniref:histidine kinase n=1 Tax=Chromohalobacter canadensis TaxID=141389 RepID=A0ABZ0YCF8_9GAMM|nr:ATP-binding protein [Chromohalobacter canadensis]MCK0767641.1 ATP-binding protein [Chromohalobacter canadensis]WQH09763.1 ATP-binding protein [Chromohalobacter canadensis]